MYVFIAACLIFAAALIQNICVIIEALTHKRRRSRVRHFDKFSHNQLDQMSEDAHRQAVEMHKMAHDQAMQMHAVAHDSAMQMMDLNQMNMINNNFGM